MAKERPPLEEMTLRQMRKVASELGISRYSRMRKDQLLSAILDAQGSPVAPTQSQAMEPQERVEANKFELGQEDIVGGLLSSVDEGLEDLPEGYGESRIVLMARDPEWAYAYWDLPNEHKDELRRQGGQQLTLRIYDVTDVNPSYQVPHSTQEYPCDELAREWYLPIPVSDRHYMVEIGYRCADGRWLVLATSAPVHIPPVYPSDWIDDRFISISWDEELRGKTFLEMAPTSRRIAYKDNPDNIYEEMFGLANDHQRVAGSISDVGEKTPGSGHMISGAGLTTSGAGLTTSGAGLTTSGMGLTTSGVGLTTSGVGLTTSGVGLTTSGVGLTTSGVGLTTSGVGLTTSGVGLTTSGVGLTTSGVGLTTSGVGLTTSGVGLTTSGVGLTTSGMGLTTSGVGLTTSGMGLTTSGVGLTTSGMGLTTWYGFNNLRYGLNNLWYGFNDLWYGFNNLRCWLNDLWYGFNNLWYLWYGFNNLWYGFNNLWYGFNNLWYGFNNLWYGFNNLWYGFNNLWYGRGLRNVGHRLNNLWYGFNNLWYGFNRLWVWAWVTECRAWA